LARGGGAQELLQTRLVLVLVLCSGIVAECIEVPLAIAISISPIQRKREAKLLHKKTCWDLANFWEVLAFGDKQKDCVFCLQLAMSNHFDPI
jgi:hypothetical protein